ncbi:two-component response regulator [gamma proteobacterium HTCC5015]|nr:two-component response regulator [gamma proteobacterium HTCC5015]
MHITKSAIEADTNQPAAEKTAEKALDHYSARDLRHLLAAHPLTLFRLPKPLEFAFHSHARKSAADWLKKSIYALILIYLIVVLPVGFLSSGEALSLWFQLAVMPIGVVLCWVWAVAQLKRAHRYVEAALTLGVTTCLSGTILCTFILGFDFFGVIAAFESIYIILIAFSVLKIGAILSLASCLGAFVIACIGAWWVDASIDGLLALLFFGVPLAICALNGLMLEFAARKDFLQTLCHQKEKTHIAQQFQQSGLGRTETNVAIQQLLERTCEHMGWLLGRAKYVNQGQVGGLITQHVASEVSAPIGATLNTFWPERSTASFVTKAAASGLNAQEAHAIHLGEQKQSTHLVFPVVHADRCVAVLEFISPRLEALDTHASALMEQIVQQCSQVIGRKKQQRALQQIALKDRLTGLPNRSALIGQIQRYIDKSLEDSNQSHCALLLMGIDSFKTINERHGQPYGDQLLTILGQRLRHHLPQHYSVFRISSDEFAILAPYVDSNTSLQTFIDHARKVMNQKITIQDESVSITCGYGVTASFNGYQTGENMLDDAIMAMHIAKQQGHNKGLVFEESMRSNILKRHQLIEDLRRNLLGDENNNPLYLEYQAIVSSDTGRTSGFEALVRWQHSQYGKIRPDELIELAADSQQLSALTYWVLNTAAQQLGEWQNIDPNLTMSVNICATFFAQDDLVHDIIDTLERHHVQPSTLRLEITESEIIEHISESMNNLNRLHQANIPVYLDDFGTGYSSFHYLASYPIHTLKIDKSFMHDIERDEKGGIVVKNIITLCRDLGLAVIAEGVENKRQAQFLKQLNCDYIQGYLYSKPLPKDDAVQHIGKQLTANTAPV